ncbi:MAG: cytochrome c biogenesis protein CcdA [Ruminococcaceae bacterium]|nr:cytochrome c biogenesis protein CcdA [Oscillospiraceae bacterium]
MEYLITFLEGVISFISPCMLPMLPVYLTLFAGEKNSRKSSILNALCFILGFTLVFVILGLFAGVLGSLISKFNTALCIICGLAVILFGLSYLNIIHIPFFKGHHGTEKVSGVFSAFIFGMIFSVSHAPCIGAFLGSALALAAQTGGAAGGIFLLLSYSLGMGVPFLISALVIKRLSTVLTSLKKHYKIINRVCGVFLIVVGFLMMTGLLHELIHTLGGCSHA